MVSSVCGGNQVRSTKDKCVLLQSSMVVGVSCKSAAGTRELQFIERTMNANMYCDITEAEHDPLPLETGSQGSIPTW